MGAYGSPELYPFEYMNRKCPKCGKAGNGKFCSECGTSYGKKYYIRKASVWVISISIVVFILCFLAGGRDLKAFFLSAFVATIVSFIGNVMCIFFCLIKKRSIKFHLSQALFAMGMGCISVLLFGLICV